MAAAIETRVNFLERSDFYDAVKPYVLTFKAPEGFPSTNVRMDNRTIAVHDIRGREKELKLEERGFAVMALASELPFEAWDDDERVRAVYLPEVAEALKKLTGASRVQIYEHILRKRHDVFPIATGEPYKFNQPTSIAHIDMTDAWGRVMAQRLNNEEGFDNTQTNWMAFNIWKPLRGPVRDWPLALCDPTSVRTGDTMPGDLVYSGFVMENQQVHYHEDQKWYYLSDQSADEAWVFLQGSNSAAKGVPHTSFPLPPSSEEVLPRQSIEVRALAFFDN